MAGLLGWVDPAREWWKGRPDVVRGLLSGVSSLASDPAAREAAMARQPKPFTDESAKNAQAMAEGFWNPGGLLGSAVGMTKFEKAHKVAQRNAAKPVEKGGLGLPKDNTAMDRARAMGFEEEGLLHGTTNDFPAFTVSNRSSVYATDAPPIADIYALAEGRHRGLREVNAGPNVIPLMARGKTIEVSDLGPNGHGWWTDNLASALGLSEAARPMAKKAKEMGYDRVKVTNMADLGGEQTQHIFPDPSVLRSRFAAFDPARKHEADLLAGYFGFQLPQFGDR